MTTSEKLQLPVEVIGSNLDGRQFIERTQTLTVHYHGATILLTNKLAPESEVILRNPDTTEEVLAFVVGEIRVEASGHVYGILFLDPSANLWHAQSPPAASPKVIRLECNTCHFICAVALSEIELEVLQATRELTRSCSVCKSSAVWRETRGEITGNQQNASPKRRPASSPVASAVEERRKNRRATMKTVACILYAGVEDVVPCEDMSRGGIRFISRRQYPEGTRVEVAAPYTKSSTNFFSPASVIYCHKMEDGRFRYGVTYIQRRGSIGWDP